MKTCPKCNADVENHFDICWNCQYSFVEQKILDNSDFKLVCPKCNTEIEPGLNFCPECHFNLAEINRETGTAPHGPKSIECLRCKVELDYQGNYRFHEGTRIGALGDLFELFTNRESFDLYSCPNCGKVEFFLPGYD